VERLSIEPPSNGEAKELSGKPLWDGNGDGGLKHGTIIIKKDVLMLSCLGLPCTHHSKITSEYYGKQSRVTSIFHLAMKDRYAKSTTNFNTITLVTA